MQRLDQKSKDIIGMKLTNRLSLALEQGEIVVDDLAQAIDMILPVVNSLENKEQLFSFLVKLSQAWPFFRDVLTEEEKQDKTLSSIEQAFAERNVQMFGMGKAP